MEDEPGFEIVRPPAVPAATEAAPTNILKLVPPLPAEELTLTPEEREAAAEFLRQSIRVLPPAKS